MRDVTVSQARGIIRALCEEIGIPVPQVRVMFGVSYVSGEYSSSSMDIILYGDEGKIPLSTVLHEFLHYLFHLVSVTNDSDEEEDVEHRAVMFLERLLMEYVQAGFLEKRKSIYARDEKKKRGHK